MELRWRRERVNLVTLPEVAAEVLRICDAGGIRVLALDGAMGAGKTTFVRAMAQELGVRDEVASPTFGLINVYSAADGARIHHMDWYRASDERELWDAGVPELLDSGDRCWVEWPERAEGLFPAGAGVLRIDVAGSDEERVVSLFSA